VGIGTRCQFSRCRSEQRVSNLFLYSKGERLALLKRILAAYNERYEDVAAAVSRETGTFRFRSRVTRKPLAAVPTSKPLLKLWNVNALSCERPGSGRNW